jgi:hypothetical protein
MKPLVQILVAVTILLSTGCSVVPEPPSLYDEEVVLRVWDALDLRYGGDAFFECEYLTVVEGRIEIIKPYPISEIAVATYLPPSDQPEFLRRVESTPGEDDFALEGTTLRFHPCHNDRNLFVAWIPASPGTRRAPEKEASKE